MKCFCVILALISIWTQCFASKLDGQEVTFDDIIQAMISDERDEFSNSTVGSPVAFHSTNGFLIFRNLKISFNRKKDNFWDKRFAKGAKDKILITKGIEFIDCEFPDLYWFVLRDFVFQCPVGFRRTRNAQLYFRDCEFQHHLTLRGGNYGFLHFERCHLKLGFNMSENSVIGDYITFQNSLISYDSTFYHNPIVNTSQNVLGNLDPKPTFFEIDNKNNPFSISFIHTNFIAPQNTNLKLSFHHSTFNSFEFSHCKVNVPLDLSFVSISNQLKFRNFETNNLILAEALNFNPANSKLDWDQINEYKIAIKTDEDSLFSGKSVKQILDDYYFNTLISVYALLYSCYKSQGNRLYANQCYVEWKNIETSYLESKFKKQQHFDVQFFWLMNVFLYIFCDYGTNPIKSILWSGYVILGFSCIYLLFPNTNNLPDEYLYSNRLLTMLSYFTENKRLYECVFSFFDKRGFKNQVIHSVRRNKGKIPKFIMIFSDIFNYDTFKWITYWKIKIIRKLDNFAGRWNEIRPGRKKWVVFMYASLMAFSFIYLGLIKILNAIMLSLNVFSTLGFGDIPVQGFAKYLTVIEGFIGWFLLSIFSVALITQIIQ